MHDGVGNLEMLCLLKFAEQNTREEKAVQRGNSRDRQMVPFEYSAGH